MNVVRYRLQQVRQQLGFVEPLSSTDVEEVKDLLPRAALTLFQTMSHADQQHSLRVCRGLQARGCTEEAMLMAALLHDVGKAEGRVPFWTRPAIVIGKHLVPRLLARLTVTPTQLMNSRDGGRARWARGPLWSSVPMAQHVPKWQRSLSYAWWHAEIGAELAAQAGLPERAVLYIRRHHHAHGPAAELHSVDEVS
jgi:hypothetical protein